MDAPSVNKKPCPTGGAFLLIRIFLKQAVVLAALGLCTYIYLFSDSPQSIALEKFLPNQESVGIFDWPIFVETAKNFIHTGELYPANSALYGPAEAIYKFPPLFVALIVSSLEMHLTAEADRVLIASAQSMLYVLSLLVCLKLGSTEAFNKKNMFSSCLAIFCFIALFEPFSENQSGMQLEVFILFLLCLSFRTFIRGNFVSAGAMLGLAVSFKIYPIIFCTLIFIRNPLKVALGVILGFMVANLFSILILGFDSHWVYYHDVLPVLMTESINVGRKNVSLVNALVISGFSRPFSQAVGNLMIFSALSVIFFIGIKSNSLFGKKYKGLSSDKSKYFIGFSLIICAFLLGLKNVWGNYQLLLVLPMAFLFSYYAHQKSEKIFPLIALIISFALIFIAPHHRLKFLCEISIGCSVGVINYSFIWFRIIAVMLVLFVATQWAFNQSRIIKSPSKGY